MVEGRGAVEITKMDKGAFIHHLRKGVGRADSVVALTTGPAGTALGLLL